jgi:hypothetical protein
MTSHIKNAAGVFFPATRQSMSADINEIRRELTAASAGLSMDKPAEAEVLNRLFAAGDQLRKMEKAANEIGEHLCKALFLETKLPNRATVENCQ